MFRKPVDILLGMSDDAAAALGALDIENVFDLALSHVFAAAVEIDDAADIADQHLQSVRGPARRFCSVSARPARRRSPTFARSRSGSSQGSRTQLELDIVLGVLTVRDLAVYPPIALRAYFCKPHSSRSRTSRLESRGAGRSRP